MIHSVVQRRVIGGKTHVFFLVDPQRRIVTPFFVSTILKAFIFHCQCLPLLFCFHLGRSPAINVLFLSTSAHTFLRVHLDTLPSAQVQDFGSGEKPQREKRRDKSWSRRVLSRTVTHAVVPEPTLVLSAEHFLVFSSSVGSRSPYPP